MGKAGELPMNLTKQQQASPPSPPPPPPPPRSMWSSYTRREIERFWRKKRLVEEDHLLAAIKAAARLRATHLSKEEYRRFLESLEEIEIKEEGVAGNKRETKDYYGNNQEIRVGIKDWWTKSKYAYLNEPAVGTVKASRRSNYKPNNMFMCNYTLTSPVTISSSKAPYLGIF